MFARSPNSHIRIASNALFFSLLILVRCSSFALCFAVYLCILRLIRSEKEIRYNLNFVRCRIPLKNHLFLCFHICRLKLIFRLCVPFVHYLSLLLPLDIFILLFYFGNFEFHFIVGIECGASNNAELSATMETIG